MQHRIIMATAAVAVLLATACLAEGPGSDAQIRFYQWRVSIDPDEYTTYDHLGSAYLQKARETGDGVYYGLSEKSFAKALSLLAPEEPEAAATSAHMAALYLAEHRFSEALTLAQKAVAVAPKLLSAYATIGDAQLETGRYGEAEASFAKLYLPADALPPRPGLDFLWETRQAGLCYIKGRPRDAVEHMQAAMIKAQAAHLPKENVAWTQFSVGELYFGMGELGKAEDAYQAALRTYPAYHRALAWLAQLRAAQGRYSEAAELYGKALAIVPLPVYAAALGDVYAKLGQADQAKKQYDLVALIARISALNQQMFRRELALFYADHNVHLGEALEFAERELQQRQDVYTWDVLAWARFRSGKIKEADAAIAHALAQGTRDPMLFFHAGMIYDRAGDTRKAEEYLRKALAINPHFHVFYPEMASRTLADLTRRSTATYVEGTANAR